MRDPSAWLVGAGAAALACVVALVPGLATALELDRAVVGAGEWWRVVGCHWAHWSADHLLWDAAACGLLLALAWAGSARRALAALGAATLAIPLGVWILLPALERYRGLSGLDSALFVLVAVSLFRRERAAGSTLGATLTALALIGFAGKVAFESASGSTLFASGEGFVPVPLAHAIGGLCGLVAALPARRRASQPAAARSAAQTPARWSRV